MFIVGVTLRGGHGVITQFLTRLTEAGSLRSGLDRTVLQVFHPFLQRRDGHLVELVDPDQDVFREYLGRQTGNDRVPLLDIDQQAIFRMHADELVLPVIEIILPDTNVEIKDADGVNLFHPRVGVAQMDVLRNGFRHAIQYTLQIIELPRVLDLDDDNLALAIQGLDVHSIELVVGGQLVPLALQQLHDRDFLAQEYGEETLQHVEIRLLPEQALDGPVETDVSVLHLFHKLVLVVRFHSRMCFDYI